MELPNPGIWDEADMHRAVAVRDITAVYRRLNAQGFTQAKISKATGQSQSDVSEITNGRRVVSYAVLARIADGLGIPRGHMGLAYGDAEGNLDAYGEEGGEGGNREDDEMISRRFLGMASAGLLGDAIADGPIMQLGTSLLGEPGGLPLLSGPAGKLGKSDVAWIEAVAARFREFDHEYGGTAIHKAAQGVAEQVIGALHTSPSLADLQLAGAELLRISAWTAYDAGDRNTFWSHIATALDLAKKAGHAPTVAVIVDDAARAEKLAGRHQAAAKLFELVTIRRKPSAVDWSLLAGAYVPLSPEAARHALDRAADASGIETDGAQGAIGGVRLELCDFAQAVEAFGRSLPNRNGRAALLDEASLASAYLQAGATTTGLHHAERALGIAELVRSKQGTDVMRQLGNVLAIQKDSTAQDLAQRITSLPA